MVMSQIKMAQVHWDAIQSRYWHEKMMPGELRRHAIDRWWNSCEQCLKDAIWPEPLQNSPKS